MKIKMPSDEELMQSAKESFENNNKSVDILRDKFQLGSIEPPQNNTIMGGIMDGIAGALAVKQSTLFESFPKIGRLSRGCTITEKIDGTNAQIFIGENGEFLTGSRNRWVTPGKQDNYGFSRWAHEHKDELLTLGPGRHFGEWWGLGIQRGYGLTEKRFSLFNTNRWRDGRAARPACCSVVPILYEGVFNGYCVDVAVNDLRQYGSMAAPGFMRPEGIVIYHHATRQLMKKTLENDDKPKGSTEE